MGSGLSYAHYGRCKIACGIVIRCHSCGFVSLFIPDLISRGAVCYTTGETRKQQNQYHSDYELPDRLTSHGGLSQGNRKDII